MLGVPNLRRDLLDLFLDLLLRLRGDPIMALRPLTKRLLQLIRHDREKFLDLITIRHVDEEIAGNPGQTLVEIIETRVPPVHTRICRSGNVRRITLIRREHEESLDGGARRGGDERRHVCVVFGELKIDAVELVIFGR
jgi:hypothetical protein